jgi:hypothetical protein
VLTVVLPASLAAAESAGGPKSTPHGGSRVTLPYGVSQRNYDIMMAQIPLEKAATQIQIAAGKPGAGHDGFFETEFNNASHSLTVRWHGGVPSDIMRLITELRGTVRIQIAPARYSLATLKRDAQLAMRQPGAVGAYPLNDGGGIHVLVKASHLAAAGPAISRAAGVPVQASASGGERLQATCGPWPADTAGPGHRCYDLPAYWGGDVIISNWGWGCTGGFGVHDASGRLYMMTAAHCAETTSNNYQNGVTFYNGNYTETMGNIIDVPGPLDAALIPADTGNRYYDGPGIKNGDSSFTKSVSGQLGASVHQSLCESGSFGGVICGMIVQNLDYTDGPWNSMAWVTSSTGRYSVDGDSGGPWFSLASSTSVYAIGIHHGITYNIFGFTNGESFTPILPVSGDLGVYVNG